MFQSIISKLASKLYWPGSFGISTGHALEISSFQGSTLRKVINNSYRLVSATIVLFIGTTVVRWELHTGDWNTAFALGSFLVGMVTVIATLRHL